MAAPYPNPQISALYDTIQGGTNFILQEINQSSSAIQSTVDQTATVIANVNSGLQNFTSDANGLVAHINELIAKIKPALDDIQTVEDDVTQISNLLFVIMIISTIISCVYFLFAFFRDVYPYLNERGGPRAKTFRAVLKEQRASTQAPPTLKSYRNQ